jgi:hypothetical protein
MTLTKTITSTIWDDTKIRIGDTIRIPWTTYCRHPTWKNIFQWTEKFIITAVVKEINNQFNDDYYMVVLFIAQDGDIHEGCISVKDAEQVEIIYKAPF